MCSDSDEIQGGPFSIWRSIQLPELSEIEKDAFRLFDADLSWHGCIADDQLKLERMS